GPTARAPAGRSQFHGSQERYSHQCGRSTSAGNHSDRPPAGGPERRRARDDPEPRGAHPGSAAVPPLPLRRGGHLRPRGHDGVHDRRSGAADGEGGRGPDGPGQGGARGQERRQRPRGGVGHVHRREGQAVDHARGVSGAALTDNHRRSKERDMEATASTTTDIRDFTLEMPQEELDDLRRRILATRWPSEELVDDRSQGVQLATIQALAGYWTDEYDWRKCEGKLNALPQFTTE